MREFVVLGHEAPTDPEFSLDDLPGSGRMDLLARSVVSGLLVSHGIREGARVHLVLDDAFTVTVDGTEVRRLNPDERSTAALVRTALERAADAIGHQPVETTPGVELRGRGFEPTLDDVAADGTLVFLHEDGTAAAGADPPEDPTFVLSDHRDLAAAEQELLEDRDALEVSLGPVALHADQAITVAHNWLDTGGYQSY